jgi:hypothetical protein
MLWRHRVQDVQVADLLAVGPDLNRRGTLGRGQPDLPRSKEMVRSGWFPGFPRVPFTPGVDIVGVVDKLGEGVATVEPGQRVAGGPSLTGGGYAEFVCRPASELVPSPGRWILPRPSAW